MLALRVPAFSTNATVVPPSRRPTLFTTVFSLFGCLTVSTVWASCVVYPRSCYILFTLPSFVLHHLRAVPHLVLYPTHDIPYSCCALFRTVPFFVCTSYTPSFLPTLFVLHLLLTLRLRRPLSLGWISCLCLSSASNWGVLSPQLHTCISVFPRFVRFLP